MSVDDFAKHFQWLTDEKTIKALEKMKKREQKERKDDKSSKSTSVGAR